MCVYEPTGYYVSDIHVACSFPIFICFHCMLRSSGYGVYLIKHPIDFPPGERKAALDSGIAYRGHKKSPIPTFSVHRSKNKNKQTETCRGGEEEVKVF